MRVLVVMVLVAGMIGAWGVGLSLRLYGNHRGPGTIEGPAIDAAVVGERQRTRKRAASRIHSGPTREILFGDLHVHSNFSTDAFLLTLPLMGGVQGAHPIADACDFARYCSALDFWSINDHAEASTPLQAGARPGDRLDPPAATPWRAIRRGSGRGGLPRLGVEPGGAHESAGPLRPQERDASWA